MICSNKLSVSLQASTAKPNVCENGWSLPK
jgi:hypothetical protein